MDLSKFKNFHVNCLKKNTWDICLNYHFQSAMFLRGEKKKKRKKSCGCLWISLGQSTSKQNPFHFSSLSAREKARVSDHLLTVQKRHLFLKETTPHPPFSLSPLRHAIPSLFLSSPSPSSAFPSLYRIHQIIPVDFLVPALIFRHNKIDFFSLKQWK